MNEKSESSEGAKAAEPASQAREQDAIYQNGRIVGRAVDPELDLEAREIRFAEICGSDHLLIPEECEFQKYRIAVQKIAFATKLDKRPGREGRTLGGCTAEILGYREQ
ncbi:MAG: hypothetical protein P8Z30_16815 [Acidobacteriota bacterium]